MIPLGIGTRSTGVILPDLIRNYGGDTFFATCIFFGVRFLATQKQLSKVGAIAYLICLCIETLQLYQAPWIQKVRHTYPFGLLLGYGFVWSDWICYAVGVVVALTITYPLEYLLFQNTRNKNL
ncbi:hypothetical protein SAE01_33640 [Segetibacter aerophilus]|uniref:DUF2809 domain-containing protein n=2 Tax=Segetibacter aerophilus TaxID=670293 RepID=A0A512BFX0_9BACT|nr:hypothetical protein SAE01_33640 [Segetibacter aerophilus]